MHNLLLTSITRFRNLMSRYLIFTLIFCWFVSDAFPQQVIAEFSSKNRQFDFKALPVGDSILVSYDEAVGTSSQRRRLVKWVSKDSVVDDTYCPAGVFAVERKGNNLYYYYKEKKSIKAFERVAGTQSINYLPASVEFDDQIVLANYVRGNLFFVTLHGEGNIISVTEISGMRVLKTASYRLPISLKELITRRTPIELYHEPRLNMFKGIARVKIFISDAGTYLVIDDSRPEQTPAGKNVAPGPNVGKATTHVFHLGNEGKVGYHRFPSVRKVGFGSFVFDGKLFQNQISKSKLSLLVFNLKGQQLMRYDVNADSVWGPPKSAHKINLRGGKKHFQGWDNFRLMFKQVPWSDPLIGVAGDDRGYWIQWGTYYDDTLLGAASGPNLAAEIISFAVSTAIVQAFDGPGVSRYFYFNTDLDQGKILPVQSSTPGLPRAKIDVYERDRQKKKKSPFESKSYFAISGGTVAVYRLKQRHGTNTTQFVYFD